MKRIYQIEVDEEEKRLTIRENGSNPIEYDEIYGINDIVETLQAYILHG